MKRPFVINWGAGRDSTAVAVGCAQRGIRPDGIFFADVGAERPETYAFIEPFNCWCRSVGFPEVTVIRYKVTDFKHWPPYNTLEENCLTNCTLPGISIGQANCSGKWKAQAIDRYMREHFPPAIEVWEKGEKVTKAIGFEHSPHEYGRAKSCHTFAVKYDEYKWYDIWFPLQEWKWDLTRCIEEIKGAGLPVPMKSSCYFCLAMKPREVDELHPEQLRRIIVVETRAKPRFTQRAIEDGWPNVILRNGDRYLDGFVKGKARWTGDREMCMVCERANLRKIVKGTTMTRLEKYEQDAGCKLTLEGIPAIEGLWRSRVRGFRGSQAKPGSMTEYIRRRGLLPAAEVDRIIAATPTELLTKADMERLGFNNWQDWLNTITSPDNELMEQLANFAA